MALRNNKSFGAAAKEIMDDVALWQEVLLSTPSPTKRAEKEINRTDGPHGVDDDLEDTQAGQGGGGGSWGRKRRRGGRGRGRGRGGKEQDPDGGKKTEHGGYGGWWSQKGHSGGPMVGAAAAAQPTRRGPVVGPRRRRGTRPPHQEGETLRPTAQKKVGVRRHFGAGPWLMWDLVGQPKAIISWGSTGRQYRSSTTTSPT